MINDSTFSVGDNEIEESKSLGRNPDSVDWNVELHGSEQPMRKRQDMKSDLESQTEMREPQDKSLNDSQSCGEENSPFDDPISGVSPQKKQDSGDQSDDSLSTGSSFEVLALRQEN